MKDVVDISDIWARLIAAYGDPKIMLSKKIAEVHKVEDLWKQKDPEKFVLALSIIINLMRDLMHMAKEHSIESKLYHGDAIDKIHGLLGHARFRKWLTIVCDEDVQEGEQHWNGLVQFLEKEVKISQHEMVWSAKMTKKEKPDRDSKGTKNSGGVSSHHTSGTQGNSVIC